MSIVEWMWAGLLVVILMLFPLVILGLHRIWAAARNIDYYLGEMVTATDGIVKSTSELAALEDTIDVAGNMLSSGGSIHGSGKTIRELLAQRAAGQG